LNKPENRAAFAADEVAYLAGFRLTTQQQAAVLQRDYLQLLRLGGNIYYTFKIAIFDRSSMQHVGAQMSGITEAEFSEMMIRGGRPIEGNRRLGEA
jgi:protocatechuate 4,5-dioxygenase alpha chain